MMIEMTPATQLPKLSLNYLLWLCSKEFNTVTCKTKGYVHWNKKSYAFCWERYCYDVL